MTISTPELQTNLAAYADRVSVPHPLTGNVFYVGSAVSGATDSGAGGLTPERPYATIDFAIGNCTSNNGDVIFVMPSHAETLTAAGQCVFDVAGVKVIGWGVGTTRPTITFGTATTADVDIDAANVYISGLRFVSDVNSLAVMLDVNAGNFTVENCDFITSSTKECMCFVDLATTVDDFIFRDCYFHQPTDPAGSDGNASTGCFYFVDSENILIENCRFFGNFETSIFHNKTTAASELWIIDCYGSQLNTGVADIADILAATTGGMVRCSWMVPAAAEITEAVFLTVAASCTFGFHHTTFMNDGAGGNRAVEVAAAT